MNGNSEQPCAEVLFPYPLPGTLSYAIPHHLIHQAKVGKRVIAQLKNRSRVGIIKSIRLNVKSTTYRLKNIEEIVDEAPVITTQQIALLDWISGYYVCPPGLVLQAMLPAAIGLNQEVMISYRSPSSAPVKGPDQDNALAAQDVHPAAASLHAGELSLEGQHLLSRLREMGAQPLSKLIQGKRGSYSEKLLLKTVIDLEAKGLIEVETRFRAPTPRKRLYIYIAPPYNASFEQARFILEQVSGAEKQERVILALLAIITELGGNLRSGVPKSTLAQRAGTSDSPLNTLVKKGFLIEREEEQSQIRTGEQLREGILLKDLSPEQEQAKMQIQQLLQEQHDAVLLHGVTGSGKTEIYFHLIAQAITEGKQVLYLLPEIALTHQIVERLRSAFGNSVGLYHSRIPESRKHALYNTMIERTRNPAHPAPDIILGARSSVFLPFQDLGLIVVDEEHDGSFKQNSPAPLYNGRDVALVLGRLFQCPVLLASATPAIESYYLAEKGQYKLVTLQHRWGPAMLPDIELLDMRGAHRNLKAIGHFHKVVIEAIKNVKKNGEQAILFQNRRGYAPFIECADCGWVAMCPNCDIRLTYHSADGNLHCHHCDHKESSTKTCPDCGSHALVLKGLGTQRVEEELQQIIPELAIGRLDLDTAKKREETADLLERFAQGSIDVLIGTQMVTKGLDFKKVTLVAVLDADGMLSIPDFRSWERAFALMLQVGGRAGRASRPGTVYIQTRHPDYPIFKWVKKHDYNAFYKFTIPEREALRLPPFYRIIEITLRHKEKERVERAAGIYAAYLHDHLQKELEGPFLPLVAWEQRHHKMMIRIRYERKQGHAKIRALLQNAAQILQGEQELRWVEVIVNVDPQ